MPTSDSVGTARDIIGPLTDIARAMKAQHQALESGRLQGPTGPTGPTGATGATGATGPTAPWWQPGGDVNPTRITVGPYINFTYDTGTHTIAITTTMPIPTWYQVGGDVNPERITLNRGIDFAWDPVTKSIAIGTNFDPGDLIHNPTYTYSSTDLVHRLTDQGVAPFGSTTTFTYTEAQWKANANAPIVNPGIGTASITVQVVGREPADGSVFDHTYKGTIFRYYSSGLGNWTIYTALTLVSGMSIGTASTLTVAMSLGGIANGTISISVTNANSGSPPYSGNCSDFAVFITILGSGNYGP